jgi:hypothetical protein
MSFVDFKVCSWTVFCSRSERSSKALSRKSHWNPAAAAGYIDEVAVCPVDNAECGADSGDDDRVVEGVGDVGFEVVGLDADCEAEEGSVLLATGRERWRKTLLKCRNGPRFFSAVPMPAISTWWSKIGNSWKNGERGLNYGRGRSCGGCRII